MIDNSYALLYYKVTGKIYKEQFQMIGGFNNEKKNRGFGLLTKYWGVINRHLNFHKSKGI